MAHSKPTRLVMNREVGLSVADLVIVVILSLVLAEVMTFDLLGNGPLRVLIGLPFALFLPGYAFIAALFPERPDPDHKRGIDWPERLALSFGTSIAILPVSLLALSATPYGLTTGPIAATLVGIIVLGSIVGAGRRLALPEHRRMSVTTLPRVWRPGTDSSRSKVLLNVLLVGSILFAGTAVSYAFAAPELSNSYTQFYLLHENPDGERVAGGYPSEIALGESVPFVVGIENQESATQTYSVVVQLQELQDETVVRRTELTRYETQITAGDRAERELLIEPQMAGEDLRITYLLYKGAPPEEPTSENAYRRLYVWVTVVDTGR